MQGTGVDKSFSRSRIGQKQKIDAEGVRVGKSGHVESDVVSDTVSVNATLSL